jgi:uncharacterized Zn finger protein
VVDLVRLVELQLDEGLPHQGQVTTNKGLACSGGCTWGSVGSGCEHMVAIFLVFLMALRIFSGSAHPIIINFC